jgi:hypothetical protein
MAHEDHTTIYKVSSYPAFQRFIFHYLSDENYSKKYQLEAVSELRP